MVKKQEYDIECVEQPDGSFTIFFGEEEYEMFLSFAKEENISLEVFLTKTINDYLEKLIREHNLLQNQQ